MGTDGTTGIVYLVGAGPGDPELLTLKGRRLLGEADIVFYDYLANPELLTHIRPGVRTVFVGKKGGTDYIQQDEINRLIVEAAKDGQKVVRLKGGDPLVFGRGGEEAEELAAAGIPFEFVPGITSAIAAPTYAGIPLTHRDFTATVTFATGNEKEGKEGSLLPWEKLAAPDSTLVILMGVKQLASNVEQLIRHGRAPHTPAALVQWGTWNRQRSVTGTLNDIELKAKEAGIEAPAVFVVGEVVALRDKLNWFETRPLFGKRVLVTRARKQASEFARGLRELGADVRETPAIEIADPESWGPFDHAVKSIERDTWLVFTSANGAEKTVERLRATGHDIRALKGPRVVAIGPATAAACEAAGLKVDAVPGEFVAEGVVKFFETQDVKARRISIFRAAEAREVLPDALRQMGADVNVVPVYRTVQPAAGGEELAAELLSGAIDLVTFTSSSTVTNFIRLIGEPAARKLPPPVKIAAIGPITAETARKAGFRVDIEPPDFHIPSFLKAIGQYYARR